MHDDAMSDLKRAVREPGKALSAAVAVLRGRLYVLWYRLRGIRFRAGKGFRVYGSLDVRGPGEVIFGANVAVVGDATPHTYTPTARIVIGNNVLVGTSRFGCAQEIVVGDDCILAECSLSDTDHHSARADRRSPLTPVRVAPVRLARNVWVGRYAAVLPGCTVGENSVLGHGAVVMRSFGANLIIVGNPAKVAAPIPSLDGLTIPESIPVHTGNGS
jgi:acetyltransferase-like isoleucine patch superfamily enzyme